MAISFMGVAQEKGAYVSLSGGLGFTGFNYTLKGVNSDGKNQYLPGGQASLGFSYYFNEHWGIVTGAGVSHYRTHGKYNQDLDADTYYSLGIYTDDDFLRQNEFELRARLGNWKEYQTGYFLEIPVMAGYQHRFGKKKAHGMYFGVGAKVQIPIEVRYEVKDGNYESEAKLNISGYYGDEYPDFGNPNDQTLYTHGFGSIHNPNERYGWESITKVKPSIALAGEIGFLFGLSRRVDFTAGAYLDYGLNNIKKKSEPLMEGPEDYLPSANENIGEGITYNGMLNSNRTEKVNLVSYGIKLGLRVRLGKVTDRYVPEDEQAVVLERQDEKLEEIEESLRKLVELMETQGRKPGRGDTTVLILNGGTVPVYANTGNKSESEETLESKDQKILSERVFFDLNSSEIKGASIITLDKKASLMKRYPSMKVRVVGNTCDLGNERINIPLGLRRAESVKRYMIGQGISDDRIVTTTSSDYIPLIPNTSEENRALNRRVDFEVIHE